MEYRQFGTTGMRVSAVGLGCNPFGNEVDEANAKAIVNKAISLGVTYFDTADVYYEGRSEQFLGSALTGQRDDVLIATKAGNRMGPGPNDTGASRKYLMKAVEDSLQRLQTDYIDVYQIHSPDRSTPAEETMRALDDIVRSGKARYIGVSNYFEWEAAEAVWTARAHNLTPLASCQEFFNVLYRETEKRYVPFCQKYGLALIPYFPLAGALLSGAYKRGVPPPPGSRAAIRPTFRRWDNERNWGMQEQLQVLADRLGHPLPQLAINWLLTRPMLCTVIAGSDAPEHIENNVKAVEWKLTPEDLAEIDRITLVE